MSTEPVEATATLSIDTGLPPVPFKLVKHIQAGEFPDVAELLPDRLGIRTESTDKDDKVTGDGHTVVGSVLLHLHGCCIGQVP